MLLAHLMLASALPTQSVWPLPKTLTDCVAATQCCKRYFLTFYLRYGQATNFLVYVQSFRTSNLGSKIRFRCQDTRHWTMLARSDTRERGPFELECTGGRSPLIYIIESKLQGGGAPSLESRTVRAGACVFLHVTREMAINMYESDCLVEPPRKRRTINFFVGWTKPLADQIQDNRRRQRTARLQNFDPSWLSLSDKHTGQFWQTHEGDNIALPLDAANADDAFSACAFAGEARTTLQIGFGSLSTKPEDELGHLRRQ